MARGFPAWAGIDLNEGRFDRRQNGLPRVGGDRPGPSSVHTFVVTASPRGRG